jgi:hypothetical protein
MGAVYWHHTIKSISLLMRVFDAKILSFQGRKGWRKAITLGGMLPTEVKPDGIGCKPVK